MEKTIWIVTYALIGEEGISARPKVVAICGSREEAEVAVYLDMDKWGESFPNQRVTKEYDAMRTWHNERNFWGTWNIEKFKLFTTENIGFMKG